MKCKADRIGHTMNGTNVTSCCQIACYLEYESEIKYEL